MVLHHKAFNARALQSFLGKGVGRQGSYFSCAGEALRGSGGKAAAPKRVGGLGFTLWVLGSHPKGLGFEVLMCRDAGR